MATEKALAALALAALGCASSAYVDEGLVGLAIEDVNPGVVVEGTEIVITGESFVDSDWGDSSLRLTGTFEEVSGGTRDIDVSVPARFVDFDHLAVDAGPELFDAVGGEGDFSGEITVEVVSKVDGETYVAEPITEELEIRRELSPQLASAQTGGLIFVNDPIAVEGSGFLLGGNEGTTYAVVSGCFIPEGETDCTDVGPVEVPLIPDTPFSRTSATFAFDPEIAGIMPGAFSGEVSLRNDHGTGASLASAPQSVSYDLVEPAVFEISPTAASLGQYVDIVGGGFVGGEAGADTLIHLSGTFTPDGAPSGIPVDMVLVPEFVAGRTVRYVVNEDDTLGQALDLRQDTGTFTGQVIPEIQYAGDTVTGSSAQMTLRIEPVEQVVYLRFAPSYVESLRAFGLRAVDQQIRQRVVDVVQRDYAGVNLDVRIDPVTDFALYSQVDIAGPDPNGLGLFGYDNTPGKDVDNERLYDRIGGVNATTQEDGYPGFGGVFIESLFGFSQHPEGHAESLSGADPAFDEIFDPFRTDRGGDPVLSADLAGGIDPITEGTQCPTSDRATQVACAIFVLGNLIGTTVSHEIGHSLGLANPYGDGFHNTGDAPNRLMDSGGSRPFTERAQLHGDGPARFCDTEYSYLRDILPSSDPADDTNRPPCD